MDKVLIYRDAYISVFCDNQKCLLVFVTDKGLTKTVNIDSNFYTIEDDIITYKELIEVATQDKQEQINYLGTYLNNAIDKAKDCGFVLNYGYLHNAGVYCEHILRHFIEVEHEN